MMCLLKERDCERRVYELYLLKKRVIAKNMQFHDADAPEWNWCGWQVLELGASCRGLPPGPRRKSDTSVRARFVGKMLFLAHHQS